MILIIESPGSLS